MGEQEALQLARRGLEAFNSGDWGAWTADLTNQSVYEEMATGRRVQGIDANLQLVKGWKEAFPDAKGTITNELAIGNTAVVEVTYEGTQTGNLATPSGSIPPTGRRATVKAVEIVEAENGRIKQVRQYFDLASMMAQLGAGAPATA